MDENEINNRSSDVQSLVIDIPVEKKEEDFETKMNSLFNQLDEQFEKVKRYANIDIPLDQIELNQYKFRSNFQPNYNFDNFKNENLIEVDNNKDNNDNDENNNINKKVEINELKDDEEIKKKMYNEMAYQRMEEERKIKEMEIEKKREKNLEEEKRIKEEQKKREEALIQKEKEILKREKDLLKKEKDLERKREEEEKRLIEERRRKEEEEESAEKSRMLKEEEEKLRKEEEEKKKEEKRESDRIKELRIERERKEEEEKKRKQEEKEKKEQMEKLKKEKEILEEKKLKEQINNKKKNNIPVEVNNDIDDNEIKIDEINSDDSIEELEEKDFIKQKMQSINKKKSINQDLNSNNTNQKLKSGNNQNLKSSKFNASVNRFNNMSRNKFQSPTKKSQIKESTNKSIKVQKEDKIPEKDLDQKEKEKNREESEFVQKFKNSQIYPKISQDIIDKILEHIYAIDDFDDKSEENDDINIYPSITKLDTEEKNLKEKIPDFEKILKKEKLTLDDKIKKYYSEDDAFEEDQESKKVTELLSEIMNIPNETHMDILQKNFEKEKLKNLPDIEGLDNLEDLEYKLFEKDEFYPEGYSVISNLENLQTWIYKFRNIAEEKPFIMVNALRYFNHWRMCLNDGNSFYRVNMFSLLEHCIIQKDLEFFSYILNDISSDNFIEYYKEKKIEYEKPFIILSAILSLTQDNLEEKAHEYLLKAYNLKNGCFDMLMIIYLKKVLCDFGKEINKLLDEKKKSEEKVELIEEAKIDIEQIENLYLDPPKINIFYMFGQLFNINIKLYLLGGKFLEPINLLKNVDDMENTPTFIFGYFFSSYHILYSPDADNENEIFKKIVENDNPKLSKLTHILKEYKKCDICFKETNHAVFLKKKFIVCIPCLLPHIEKTIKARASNFFDDKCLGQEYYSRAIHLQDDFYLDDFDYMELVEENNIINKIYSNHKGNKCTNCEKIKSDEIELITLECKCAYCQDCFKDIIMKMTKDQGYLLPCEVDMLKNVFKCDCGKKYTYNDFEKLYDVDDEQKEKAKERLSLYKDNYCIICLKNLIQEDDVKKIKIKKEMEDDKDHFICNNCYLKHFKKIDLDSDEENITKEDNNEDKEEDRDDNEIKVIKDEQKIKCSICKRWHHYIGNVEGCGCILF